MALPAPNLDDRRFQDLVDDAKRMVMRRCPEWTDHNVSDPGVTLIETFAFMTDQLLFRLNQVPERLYVKFLELIGLRLIPPTPAQVNVTFWLSAPAVASVGIPAGTTVATPRTEVDESIVFATDEDLQIIPCSLYKVSTQRVADDAPVDRTDELKMGQSFQAFTEVPRVGDVLLVGLSVPAPNCVVRLDFDCQVQGVGVHPDHPPLVWEAWNGKEWKACKVSKDGTGALNTAGQVHVHLPLDHESSVLGGEAAGWLRAKVIEVDEDMPTYTGSPMVTALSASTVGGTVESNHCEIIEEEVLGYSEGVPGQQFPILRTPVVIGAGGLLGIGPVVEWLTKIGGNAVHTLVDNSLLPLVSVIVEPAKVLFLNNAINHGVLGPLGVNEATQAGKSVLFMIETNPGPGLGILTAYLLFGPRTLRPTVPGAMIIHFLGGIHEIYFPYVLMKPRMILAAIAGGAAGVGTAVITNAGLVATPSPGSIFAYFAVTPKGGYFGVVAAIVVAFGVAFVVGSALLGFGRAREPEVEPVVATQAAEPTGIVAGNRITRLVVACDAGMGSSVMLASQMRKRLEPYGVAVEHKSVAEIPADAQLVLTHADLAGRARGQVPEALVIEFQSFMGDPAFDRIEAMVRDGAEVRA